MQISGEVLSGLMQIFNILEPNDNFFHIVTGGKSLKISFSCENYSFYVSKLVYMHKYNLKPYLKMFPLLNRTT